MPAEYIHGAMCGYYGAGVHYPGAAIDRERQPTVDVGVMRSAVAHGDTTDGACRSKARGHAGGHVGVRVTGERGDVGGMRRGICAAMLGKVS